MSFELRFAVAISLLALAACGNTTTDSATSTAGSTASTGTGGAAGQGGANGTGGAAGQGGANGGSGGAPAQPTAFSVTITNTSGASLFIRATPDSLPFTIEDASAKSLALGTQCDCAACANGPSCVTHDWISLAVEIAAGQSALIDADLTWFVEQAIPQACKYASGFSSCGVGQSFAAGEYSLVVAYADQATVEQAGFAPSGATQWGQKVWKAGSPFIGSYPSTAGKAFTIGSGAVAITANIGGK